MKYFIAYKHSGVDPSYLKQLLTPVRDAFTSQGHEVYCTFFEDDSFRSQGMSAADIMYHAFTKIEEQGNLFVVLDSTERSEGMLMEIGYCLAKNLPVIVAIREGVNNSYLPSMIKQSFTYANTEDLAQKIINL